MLQAFEVIKDVRQGKVHWRDMIEPVEEAIEALEGARSYLFTGKYRFPFLILLLS
jgi:hypothetical protein